MSGQHTKEVLVFPRGQLSPKDKERLTKIGIVAVEADDPSSVKRLSVDSALHLAQSGVTGDLIVSSLLKALAKQKPADEINRMTSSGQACHEFVKLLSDALPPARASGDHL